MSLYVVTFALSTFISYLLLLLHFKYTHVHSRNIIIVKSGNSCLQLKCHKSMLDVNMLSRYSKADKDLCNLVNPFIFLLTLDFNCFEILRYRELFSRLVAFVDRLLL